MLRPWQVTLLDLHREVDQLFEKLIFRPWSISSPAAWRPLLDLHETPDAYVVEIDLPGVPPGEVHLLVSTQTLFITGERQLGPPEGCLGSRCERVGGAFQRQIELPSPVDPDRAEAEWRYGAFSIRLPRVGSRGVSPGGFSGARPSCRVVPITFPQPKQEEPS